MQPIPDTYSISQKINYTEIRKKNNVFEVLEMSTTFSDAYIHSFPHVWCNPVKSSCVTETVHQTRYCRFVSHRRIEKCISKLILASSLIKWCQIVFHNEHTLHLWKKHPCTWTVERKLTDWGEQVTTWRGLRGLLYSHSNNVCLLIQSNCIEMQPSVNILLWVAWLFDHSVRYSSVTIKPSSKELPISAARQVTRTNILSICTRSPISRQGLCWPAGKCRTSQF
jgi:hypothetical protein